MTERTHSPEETFALGQRFAATLKPGDVVALAGDLGSGKTQFIRGVCAGLGVAGRVTSPTFTLMNEYPVPWGTVVHVDVFRIVSHAEAAALGIAEYYNDRCICLIEWSDRITDLLPARRVEIVLAHGPGETEREISIRQIESVPA